MADAVKIGTLTFILLSGLWTPSEVSAKRARIGNMTSQSGNSFEEPMVGEQLASNTKAKVVRPEKAHEHGSIGAGKSGKYDTLLTDTLAGKNVFFRKFREKIVDQFVDSTDIALEGVTEKDSIFFRYFDTAGTKDFDLFKIPSKSGNIYLLHFQYSPSNPPSGQALLIIAPVRGGLKLLNPGQLTFKGDLSGFNSEKISKTTDGFSVSVWNGNFGIEVPIEIRALGDTTFLVLPKIKSTKLPKSTAYYFPITDPPEKGRFQKNEDVNLYLDLNKIKEMKVKTSKFEDIHVKGVWVQIEPGLKRPGIQNFLDACRDSENTLLEVKFGDQKGFLSYPDYQKLGYPDAG